MPNEINYRERPFCVAIESYEAVLYFLNHNKSARNICSIPFLKLIDFRKNRRHHLYKTANYLAHLCALGAGCFIGVSSNLLHINVPG